MHPQRSFADVEYDGQPRQTRRERFLRRMDVLLPWARLEARIRPVYPTAQGPSRPRVPSDGRIDPARRPRRRSRHHTKAPALSPPVSVEVPLLSGVSPVCSQYR